MMERFPSLKCVPAQVRDNPRYVGDHVIRHYRQRGLAALLADLGADPTTPELTISGGIGRLVLRADGSELWQPAQPHAQRPPSPPPRPADPELAAARRAACSTCDAWRDHCTAAGCGCAGEGKSEVQSSRCPLDRWPSNAVTPEAINHITPTPATA
jgi:hypothetical protein